MHRAHNMDGADKSAPYRIHLRIEQPLFFNGRKPRQRVDNYKF